MEPVAKTKLIESLYKVLESLGVLSPENVKVSTLISIHTSRLECSPYNVKETVRAEQYGKGKRGGRDNWHGEFLVDLFCFSLAKQH